MNAIGRACREVIPRAVLLAAAFGMSSMPCPAGVISPSLLPEPAFSLACDGAMQTATAGWTDSRSGFTVQLLSTHYTNFNSVEWRLQQLRPDRQRASAGEGKPDPQLVVQPGEPLSRGIASGGRAALAEHAELRQGRKAEGRDAAS